ncbi:ankyrin repeat domain-containing protein [Microbacterium excoecariae]|uniref:ankyrin repeat domain-containing protein n=1 Tax=Microbacterium excoecariae TaxID=2715210 RepID=UPI00140970EA|nr:ankyrin repeat domain-containing protein [Microbacterium excoecariae]NHI17145.1 ankyrin repeat domain-containing protein [Microbacterium excoecariae]
MDLFELARTGDTALLAAIDEGHDARAVNDSGDSLVMLAAYHGHEELVRALIARGADVNRANDKRLVPLAGALFKGHDGIVTALVDAGADPQAPSVLQAAQMLGRTPPG